MNFNYKTEELIKALSDFYIATGIYIILADPNFNTIAKSNIPVQNKNFCFFMQQNSKFKIKCIKSDIELMKKCRLSRKPVKHICHAGLIDIAIPLIHNKNISGYIILGQMRDSTEFEKIYKYISEYCIDRKKIEERYDCIPYCDNIKIQSIANIAVMLTDYIIFKNMLNPEYDSRIDAAVKFISENTDKKIFVEDICKNVNVSKSVLYRLFNKNFNCTLSEYINNMRIENAKNLLLNSAYDLEEISEKTGFSNYSYFCKTFKNLCGITPLKYRKNNT